MGGTYAEFRRPRRPWGWPRWLVARRRRRDRSDGRLYVGWSARLVEPDGEHPAGAVGSVVAARVWCGEFAHDVDFGGWVVTVPLPWPGIELVRPEVAR